MRAVKSKLTSKIGAYVQYCGHAGYFLADIFVVAGAAVVRASKPVSSDNIVRKDVAEVVTHHMVDFPTPRF